MGKAKGKRSKRQELKALETKKKRAIEEMGKLSVRGFRCPYAIVKIVPVDFRLEWEEQHCPDSPSHTVHDGICDHGCCLYYYEECVSK